MNYLKFTLQESIGYCDQGINNMNGDCLWHLVFYHQAPNIYDLLIQ